MKNKKAKVIFGQKPSMETAYIPLTEAWICPECDLIRKGPGPCACGQPETVPAMRPLTLPDDMKPIVSFRTAAIRVFRTGAVSRSSKDVLGTKKKAA